MNPTITAEPDAFSRHSTTGVLNDPAGERLVCVPDDLLRILRLSLEKELTGAWPSVIKAAGRAFGADLAKRAQTASAIPAPSSAATSSFEARLEPLERQFALHGWGRLQLDASDVAGRGLVVARLEHSYFVEAFADVHGLVDAMFAGVLQGYFEAVAGRPLGCEEVACVRQGASLCTFVVAAQSRLDAIASAIGRESATAILARLKSD
jgi:predicted hydrocarbon binding protein